MQTPTLFSSHPSEKGLTSPPTRQIGPDRTHRLNRNIAFKVHKMNLAANSIFFRDMFKIASGSGGADDEIPMVEEASVLEAILPYCYPDVVDWLTIPSKVFWDIAKACDKYQVCSFLCGEYPRAADKLHRRLGAVWRLQLTLASEYTVISP